MADIRAQIHDELADLYQRLGIAHRRLAELEPAEAPAAEPMPAVLDRAGLCKLVGKGIRWCQMRMLDAGFPRGQSMGGSAALYWRRSDVEAWMLAHLEPWSGRAPRRGARVS